jgi:pyruvate formate lyase activating enzyme
MKEARFWEKEGERVVCSLCPHLCKIDNGRRGICGVRENQGGRLVSLIYGQVSSVHVDPIEKKPFFHFMPGKRALSLGTIGCNMKCLHCQNYTISQARFEEIHLREFTPDQVCDMSEREKCPIIAWTYNEPSIWHEFTLDTSKEAKRRGLRSVYVTNGFIEEEPLREIAPYLDGMNVDIKAFHDGFYKKICKARLEPVLRATELAHELGKHLELTYLVIPGKNDSKEEIGEFSRWVRDSLDPSVPVHFSRFHPDYLMTDVPLTPMETLEMAYQVAREAGLRFVYLGNIPVDRRENTYCPKCGNLAIRRTGFSSVIMGMKEGKCAKCGTDLNMVI